MKKRKIIITILITLTSSNVIAQLVEANNIIENRIVAIKKGLDSMIFVKRFESITTPCIYIDSLDNSVAHTKRKITNSNYRIALKSDKAKIDSGVECLSQYYSRYARLSTNKIDTSDQIISGAIEFTYGYSASSIIQYLGFTAAAQDKSVAFFEKLIRTHGIFRIYPEDDKYRIMIALPEQPYEKMDTIYGYLEIVKEAYDKNPEISYSLYFDRINIYKGDNNNQIFLKFTSSSYRDEAMYFTRKLYHVLKFLESGEKQKKAHALWVKSFFNNPNCSQCKFIYNQSEYLVNSKSYVLPDTDPVPAH